MVLEGLRISDEASRLVPIDTIEQISSAMTKLSRIAFIKVAGYKISDEVGTKVRPGCCAGAA